MAGVQADRGDTTHRIVSGEVPEVGLKVWTNEYKQGVIVKVDDAHSAEECGWYCPAWHEVLYDGAPEGTRSSITMNCDRLTTRKPF